jgi:hypothetical protein
MATGSGGGGGVAGSYGPPPLDNPLLLLPVIVGGPHGDPQMTAQEKAEAASKGK